MSDNNIEKKFKLPLKLVPTQKNVRQEYEELALNHNPINLGQDFGDYPPPEAFTRALAQVAESENCLLHQYTRYYGHARLVNAVAALYSKMLRRKVDAQNEVLVTVGAFEGLFATIMGHVEAGDEVIIIEPFFHCYEPMVRFAGGVPRFIPLRMKSCDWSLDKKELEKLFSTKTKIIILNNPHSPTGKVFKLEELEFIADLCRKWNVLCVSDEVYEWFTYEESKHVRISTLPEMWQRTITICSASKTFSATGWKLGWAYGPANLIHNLKPVHGNSVKTNSTTIQEVGAIILEKELKRIDQPDCYFNTIQSEFLTRRDFMVKILRQCGMKPVIPEGGCYILADWSDLEKEIDLTTEEDEWKDERFTKWLTKNLGLQFWPLSALYSTENKRLGENFVRCCFLQKQETLQKAEVVLRNWRK